MSTVPGSRSDLHTQADACEKWAEEARATETKFRALYDAEPNALMARQYQRRAAKAAEVANGYDEKAAQLRKLSAIAVA